MIKLTENDIFVWGCPEQLTFKIQIFKNESDAQKLKQQILDDYEKARKWDYVKDQVGSKLFEGYIDGRKLRELLEKKIENFPKQIDGAISPSWKKDYELLLIEFKSLLKDSKK